MKSVALAGYGNIKFSSEDANIEKLLLDSTKSLFTNLPNLEQKDINAVIVSTNDNSKYLGAILSEISGITPKVSHTVESLCNSGSNSIVSAYSYIAAGLVDMALVVGADKWNSPGNILNWDSSRGEFKQPIFWATMFSRSHKRKFGTTKEDMAVVSVKNHNNAIDNPNAYSHKTYTIDDVLNSRNLTDDLHILDCSRPCSGSSAVLLASKDRVKKITDQPIWIKGIGQKTTSAGFAKNDDMTSMCSTIHAAASAFRMAELSISDVDVAEVHDAFTICEIMAIEDLGFTEKGHGKKYVKDLFETNNKKINPRGGLIGSGHPLGATGVAQVAEITQQLQKNAGKRQVDDANIGLIHNMSAAATSSTIILLES